GLFVVVFAGRRLRLRVVDLVEQPRDAVAGLEPLVVLEEELRGMPQAQPLAQRAAHVAGGLLEPGQAGLALLLGAQHADEDAGLAEVRPEADARDGHEADAGILELARDHLRDFFADLLSEAFRPPSHRISVLTSTTWMSRARSASPATLCSVDSRCVWSVFTETTASLARCQRSWNSTSAMETLKRLRMRVSRLRKACRLSLRERAPGKCRSRVRRPITIFVF